MKKKVGINPHGGDSEAIALLSGMDKKIPIRMDFSVNINPMGPPSSMLTVLSNGMNEIAKYPKIFAQQAVSALASAHNVNESTIITGNGSTEIFSWILQSIRPERPGWISPAYIGYTEVCTATGFTGCSIAEACPEHMFEIPINKIPGTNADMIFLASPNNPTGVIIDTDIILDMALNCPEKWFIIDESFIDFLPDAEEKTLIRNDLPKNLIVVKSLTKFFAIPGLRLGMACANSSTIELIHSVSLPWTVNALAQSAAVLLYKDKEYIDKTRKMIIELREYLFNELSKIDGITVYPSEANFLLIRLPTEWDAQHFQKELLRYGILIRSCDNFSGLGKNYCRLAVRPRKEVWEIMACIRNILFNNDSTFVNISKSKPAIMVVGTMSNSGKSLVTAVLCRYFKRNGLNVAPFKAQNMSLNSFITKEGGEMGRAQVMQAMAADVTPHTDMNPILLKPSGDTGSQVIVNGCSVGNFTAKEYYQKKIKMRIEARNAYDRLSARHDLIILEGAGSPAEINLQSEDFVNMDMAEYAGASVILVADIDRGGVFASIFGTISLLAPNYRSMIKGIIINKFRGDASLLNSGIQQIEELTGIPVLGVLPYITDLMIEDEDSLGLEGRKHKKNTILDIAVIRLPRISNYTDFLSLENTCGVCLRYINNTREFGNPDLIIIPGTKNTRADLRFLYKSGLANLIIQAGKSSIPIIGICGGYQMLGNYINDPSGVEDKAGEEIGLNLLPVNTILEEKKELSRVAGITTVNLPFAKQGTTFKGYEIHAGRTEAVKQINTLLTVTSRLSKKENRKEGTVSDNGMVMGCYIHGLFDDDSLKIQLLDWLCKRKNIQPLKWLAVTDTPLKEIDRVADIFTSNITMRVIDNVIQT